MSSHKLHSYLIFLYVYISMFMHTFCKYVFVKSYADKIL